MDGYELRCRKFSDLLLENSKQSDSFAVPVFMKCFLHLLMNTSVRSSTNSEPPNLLTQRLRDFEEWTRRREGPPPLLPPLCLDKAFRAQQNGENYSKGFPDGEETSIPCMVTLAYLRRRDPGNVEVRTCGLPTEARRREVEGSDDVTKSKQAAKKAEKAEVQGDTAGRQRAMTELRQIVDRVLADCFGA